MNRAPAFRLPRDSGPLFACLAVAIALLTLAVYAPVRHHEFLAYDDHVYVTHNPNLKVPFGLISVVRDFVQPYEANWIPLTWISLHFDYWLFGENPLAFHLNNLLQHVAASLLLFAALRRMTKQLWPSAFVAAIFALHPLHVESVAWAAERKDTLSGLFWMATLYAYARYAEAPSGRRYAAVFAGFVACLLAKPVGVTLPFVLLLLDYWPLGRTGFDAEAVRFDPARLWAVVREKLPFFAVIVAAAGVTFWVQQVAGSVALNKTLPITMRVLNAFRSYAVYLLQSVWPVDLRFFYTYPLGQRLFWDGLGGLAMLVALTVLLLLFARRRGYLVVGWAWFVGVLVPMIGIVQVGMQAHADRYMYLPLVGLSLALAWGVAEWLETRPRFEPFAALAGVVLVLACSVASARQLPIWRDTRTLYQGALDQDPRNFLALYGLAGVAEVDGDLETAQRYYERAVSVRRRWSMPRAALGRLFHEQQEHEEARRYFESAIQLAPRVPTFREDYGYLLFDMGLYAEAAEQLEEASARLGRLQRPELLMRLGDTYAIQSLHSEAQGAYERALEVAPDDGLILLKRGYAALGARDFSSARADIERVAALAPEWGEAQVARGELALAEGDEAGAIAAWRAALRLGDADPQVAAKLAWLLATARDPQLRAPREVLQGAARIPPERMAQHVEWLQAGAAAAAALDRYPEAVRAQERALEVATERGRDDRAEIERRLALYRAGLPYAPAQAAEAEAGRAGS